MSAASYTDTSFERRSYSSSTSSANEKRANEHRRFIQKRTRFLLLILGGIIASLVIVISAVAIPFLILNRPVEQTAVSPKVTPTVSTSVATVTTYEVGEGGTSNSSPCSSHTVINDPSRNVNAPGSGKECDSGAFFNTSIGGRWIRFVGAGGTMLVTSPPEMQRCGAYLTGWFNGTLPTTPNTIVNTMACVVIQTGPCGYRIPMSVAKCSGFYVYFLRPIETCNGRYCTA